MNIPCSNDSITQIPERCSLLKAKLPRVKLGQRWQLLNQFVLVEIRRKWGPHLVLTNDIEMSAPPIFPLATVCTGLWHQDFSVAYLDGKDRYCMG